MTRKNALKSLKEVLLKRREALRKALDGDLSLLKELREQTSGDVVDFALDSAQDEISSQLAEVESRELANINTALERMEEGSYGKCEGCSSSIPLARLQALPYAICCIECKKKLERAGLREHDRVDWSNILDAGMSEGDNNLADLEIS